MIWGTQRPGACSMHWVLAWNSSTLVRWRTRAGSSDSLSCSMSAWRWRNSTCLQNSVITDWKSESHALEANLKNCHILHLQACFAGWNTNSINFWNYTSTEKATSLSSYLPSSAWSHTPLYMPQCWSGSLQLSEGKKQQEDFISIVQLMMSTTANSLCHSGSCAASSKGLWYPQVICSESLLWPEVTTQSCKNTGFQAIWF